MSENPPALPAPENQVNPEDEKSATREAMTQAMLEDETFMKENGLDGRAALDGMETPAFLGTFDKWEVRYRMREELLSDDVSAWLETEHPDMGLEDIRNLTDEQMKKLLSDYLAAKAGSAEVPALPPHEAPLALPPHEEKAEEQIPELKLAVVDNTEDEKMMAEHSAQRMLRESLEKGGKITKYLKGIVMGKMFRSAFLEHYKKKAMGEKAGKQEFDLGDEESALVERCLSEYDEVRGDVNAQGEKELGADANYQEASKTAREAIEAFARGKMDEAAFRAEMGRVEAALYDKGGDKVGREGKVIFGNYTAIVEAVKKRIELGVADERLMDGFSLIRGEARKSLKSEAHRDAIDKATNWLETHTGGILPTAMIAGALGVGAWFGQRAATTAGRLLAGVGGAAASGIFAGLRERNRVTADRAQRLREMETGQAVGDATDAKGRETYDGQMAETMYKMEKAGDLTKQLKELSAGDDGNKIMDALLAVRMLERTSEENGVPLISFSDIEKRRQERLDLDIAIAKAKVRAKELMPSWGGDMDINGEMDNLITNNEIIRERMGAMQDDIDAKDAAFRKLRRKKAWAAGVKMAAIGTVTGALIGFGVQEVQAAISEDTYGLADAALGLQNNADAKLTTLAGMFGMKNPNAIGVEALTGFERTGERMSVAEKAELEAKGYTVSDQVVGTDIVQTGTRSVSIEEYTNEYGTHVTRDSWANNGTLFSDGNELGAHYTGNAESGFGIVTSMTDGGSRLPNGDVITFSEMAEAGQIRAYISVDSATQGMPLEIVGRMTENGQIEFIPEPGSAAAKCFDSSGKFIGRYFEVAVNNGVDADGVAHIIPLATAVGGGLEDAAFGAELPTTDMVDIWGTTVLGRPGVEATSEVLGVPGFVPLPLFRRTELRSGVAEPRSAEPSGGGDGGGGPSGPSGPSGPEGGPAPALGGETAGSETPALPGPEPTPELPPAPERPELPPAPERPALPPVPERPELPPAPERPALPPVPERPALPPVPGGEALVPVGAAGVESRSGATAEQQVVSEEERWRAEVGELGMKILKGEVDTLPQWARDELFASWWETRLNERGRRGVLNFMRYNMAPPASPALMQWMKDTGKFDEGGEEETADNVIPFPSEEEMEMGETA